MFGRIIFKGTISLLIFLLIALPVLLNGMFTNMLIPSGAVVVFVSGTIVSTIFGFGFYKLKFSLMLKEFSWFYNLKKTRQQKVALYISILIGIITFYAPGETLLKGHQHAKTLKAMAPSVQSIVQERFSNIDSDKNGILDEAELSKAIDQLPETDSTKNILVHTKAQLSEVGHVIDTNTIVSSVWITTGSNGSGYSSPTVIIINIYGISKEDLQTYPKRVQQRWKRW